MIKMTVVLSQQPSVLLTVYTEGFSDLLTDTDRRASWPAVILFTDSHRHTDETKSWVTLIDNATSIVIILPDNLSIHDGLWGATVPSCGRMRTFIYRSDVGVLNYFWNSSDQFGCWGYYLDTGLEFHSKAHGTYTLVPESPPEYILCCRRRWQWLHTQLVFQSCCHLVEFRGPRRRWLKHK